MPLVVRILPVVLLVLCRMASAADGPIGINVPAEIRQSLNANAAASVYYGRYEVAEDGAATAVSASHVPPTVRAEADEWARLVLRSDWAPDNLRDLFYARRSRVNYLTPADVDFLCAQYLKAGGVVRIVEGPATVAVLWSNPSIQLGPDPKKTVTLLAQMLLRIPDEKAAKSEVIADDDIKGGTSLFAGSLWFRDRADAAASPRVWWYTQMDVWVAPGFFYASMEKHCGELRSELPPAKSRMVRRFADPHP